MDPTAQPKQADPPEGRPGSPRAAVAMDRRALLRAGAGASPVLLTLVTRPVVAGTTCTVASSFVSVATWRSHNPAAASPQCTTRTCEDWLTDCSSSPRPSVLNGQVNSILGATFSGYNYAIIWQVLQNGGMGISQSGELGVLQHLLCLALNARSSTYMPAPGGVTQAYVAAVWQNYKLHFNRYQPGSGIDWDSSQVIAWARMLMYPSYV